MKTITTTILAISLAAAAGLASAQETMTEQDVRAALTGEGYTHLDDIEFDDGLWKAEAHDSNGNDVELRMEPTEGRIIGQKRD